MTGSYLFNYESHYNGLMTDWSSIFSIYFFSLFVGLGLEIHLLINAKNVLSRACVRTRLTGVFVFLLSQVSHLVE